MKPIIEKSMLHEPKRRLYAGCAMLLLLSACSEVGTKKSLTQVAAKVDGEEISIHQINAVLSHAQAIPATSVDQLRKEVLDKLIDQQVIYAQALEKKLDRDPKVRMLVDTATREILARAYMDTVLASPEKISASDIHQYYVENPALFSRRKIYTLQEIMLSANPAVLEQLKEMAADGRDMEEIGKFLTSKDIEFKGVSGVRTAEQIPLDVLPRLASIPDGKTELIESGKRYHVYRVISSQIAAIDEADARPRIEVFLGNQKGQRLVAQEVQRLKSNARIEYMGDFAKTAKAEADNKVAALKSERTAQ
jgi:EpsD family peptidyl-prolyl cis-trans isomerase